MLVNSATKDVRQVGLRVRLFVLILVTTSSMSAVGCSAVALRPEANRIEIAKSVYETCRFIDDVEGRQGGPLVQAFTPDQDIKLGERNALLNEVLRKGADTVILNSMNVGTLAVADPHTMSDQKRMTGEHHDHDSRLRGRAYQCNADELAHRVSK